jgi:hypothetical protein
LVDNAAHGRGRRCVLICARDAALLERARNDAVEINLFGSILMQLRSCALQCAPLRQDRAAVR